MNEFIRVKIIGAPVACKEGIKETWREVASWAAKKLAIHYGDLIDVRFYDIFDVDCPQIPPEGQLPIIFVNEDPVHNDGKISIPAIRKKIDEWLPEAVRK